MNEIKKTSVFVGIAVVLSLITWRTGGPKIGDMSVDDMVGKFLFAEFKDPLEAVSLEIVKYDDDTGATKTFKVGKIDDLWSIPSHSDYPADAKDRMADVASGLMDLKVLQIPALTGGDAAQDDIQALHEEFGVIAPKSSDLRGGEGVGTRVIMKNKSDKDLLSLIIGKEVPDQTNLRYVRRAEQNPVYTVALDAGKLTTKFEDWIEKDLLKLSYWDIKQVEIEDYSVDILAGRQVPRGEMTLAYDDSADDKWSLAVDKVFQKAGWVEKGLGEKEELDKTKLDSMRSAVGDLKIVDVARKPEGLSADLKGGDIKADSQTAQSLMDRGFYLVPVQDPSDPSKRFYDLLSNEGQISILLKNGVRYVLRFGQIAGTPTADEEEKKPAPGQEAEKAEDDKDESAAPGANRYMFVMAQFDAGPIEKPKLETPPELPKETDAKKAEAEKPEAEKTEGTKPEGDEAKPDDAESAAAAEKAKSEAERERIEKDNQRKQEEYDGKITEGKKKVEELNARFADWYYVISNEEYNKIHLGRDDVVKEKEKEESSEGAEKPAASGAMPAMPPVSGAMPVTPPAKPAAKPATPAAKPATPAAKPATPAAKPVTPAAKPVTPAAKPAAPAAKPAAKPAAPAKTDAAPPNPLRDGNKPKPEGQPSTEPAAEKKK